MTIIINCNIIKKIKYLLKKDIIQYNKKEPVFRNDKKGTYIYCKCGSLANVIIPIKILGILIYNKTVCKNCYKLKKIK